VTDVLVVGLGSEIRGDDGAGRDVAARVDALELPGVEVVSTIQLTPELAPAMAGRDVVIVDAEVACDEVSAAALPIGAGGDGTAPVGSHGLDPGRLVALAVSLGWSPTTVTLVRVPARDLGLGEHRSATTSAAVPRAVATVVQACSGAGPPTAAVV
jgi:hydrogenase maturation protease